MELNTRTLFQHYKLPKIERAETNCVMPAVCICGSYFHLSSINKQRKTEWKKEDGRKGRGRERTKKEIKVKRRTIYATQPQHLIQHRTADKKLMERDETKQTRCALHMFAYCKVRLELKVQFHIKTTRSTAPAKSIAQTRYELPAYFTSYRLTWKHNIVYKFISRTPAFLKYSVLND